jgi:ABC-2 type transport system permease protein
MSRFSDIYTTLFKISVAIMLQYRAVLVIWLIGLVLQPIIYLVVWLTVAEARGGQVGDFDKAGLAAYYIVLMIVNHATFDWHMYEMGYRVRTGAFSPLLLQPLHPIHRDIIENVAYKFITLSVMLPAILLLTWLFEPSFGAPIWAVAAFVPALLMAFLVRFFVEWSLALSAFWITDTSGLNQMYVIAALFLTGQMAPLSLMPQWVQSVAGVLPFRWMVAFPVELLLGRLSPEQVFDGFLMQALWLGAGLAVLALTWSRAARRYSAVGA